MKIGIGDLVVGKVSYKKDGDDALPFIVRTVESNGRITLQMVKSGTPICLGALPWEPNKIADFDPDDFIVLKAGGLDDELGGPSPCRTLTLTRADDSINAHCACGTYLGYVAVDSSVDRLADMWDVHMHTGTPGEKLKSF